MNELLQAGQVLNTRSAGSCKVLSFLGGGGQGEVYKVEWGGSEFALKWYYRQCATDEQRGALEDLIRQGKPSDSFLWPEELVEAPDDEGYGYLMRLRPPRFQGLTRFVTGKVAPTYRALIVAGIQIAKAYRALHSKGLCYRDISFGNAFFDTDNGDVLICDNDNVAADRSPLGTVLGTPDFMAPEIVRGEAHPSTVTDLHSLAVLLFYLFHLGHPLIGKKVLSIRIWDAPARELIFGKEPTFIFDPADRSNEAIDLNGDPTGETGGNALRFWSLYPTFFRDTFVKAFTKGLRNPDERVTEREWLETLSALRDSLFLCACGTPNFLDAETFKTTRKPGSCWSCKQTPKLPFRLRVGNAIVMLNADSKLYPHHLTNDPIPDFSTIVAEVIRHPNDPNVWGLKNKSRGNWAASFPDGSTRDVEPGKSVPLATNVQIRFGKIVGEILY